MNNPTKIPLTYEAAHNRAVRQFKKMSMFILWSGILNIVSALVAVVGTGTADFALSYAFNDILFRFLIAQGGLSATLLGLSIVGIAVGSALIFALLGIFANMGNHLCLIIGASLYVLDFIALFVFVPFAEINITLVAVHVMFTFALLAANYLYFKVLSIEKQFHKV